MNALRGINTKWSTYQRVDSSEEVFLKEQDTESERRIAVVLQSYRNRIAILSGATVFSFACTLALLIALILKRPTDKQCGIQTSIWSPANEAIEYEVVEPQNPFAHKSPYRGPPTPELETAWDGLWLHGGFRFPEDKLTLINRTVDLGNGRSLKPWHDGKGGFQ
ncbi:hypothetical protein F5Y10DRAFT_273387 [Nemania abortiva]|nr:hypothetical protein F5Y10DRAFT_273387 [Nemania abortiva]